MTKSSKGEKAAGSKKKPQYKRIMLKLSGEALVAAGAVGVDPAVVKGIAEEIQEIQKLGVEIAIVVGGGNFFRGANETWIDRATADYIGMLATVINALVLQGALERLGVMTRVQTAIQMQELAEPYIPRRAIRHFEKGRVVIFAAGTGNPYFSTDTAAALRAMEIKAEIIMKATKVDGVYSADPKKNTDAVRYKKIKYMNVLKKNLRAMDATATSLCMDNKMPIVIFNLFQRGNIKRVVMGEDIGTFVR